MRYTPTFKKYKCRACSKLTEYKNKCRMCDDCQYLKIRMSKDIDLTKKLLREIIDENIQRNTKKNS